MDGLKTDEERVQTWLASWKISLLGQAILDKDFNFVRVNDQWVKMLGVPATEFYGKKFTDITDQSVLGADIQQANLVIEGKIDSYMMHKTYRFSDGSHKNVSLLVTRVPLDTTKPFLHFLSRIMLRGDSLNIKENSKKQFLSDPQIYLNVLNFLSKYWVWIATATAVITGLLNEIFNMGFF